MDIKLKKSKITYSLKSKATAVIVTLICSITAFIGLAMFISMGGTWGSSPLNYETYFDTMLFADHFDSLVYDAVKVNVIYKSEDNIKSGNTLFEDSYIRELADNYGLDLNYVEGTIGYITPTLGNLKHAREEKNSKVVSEATNKVRKITNSEAQRESLSDSKVIKPEKTVTAYDSNEESYKEFMKFLDEEYPTYKKNLIQNQLYEFKYLQEELNKTVNFNYCIYDSNDEKIAGNSYINKISDDENLVLIDGPYISDSSNRFLNSRGINEALDKNDCKIYASVNTTLIPKDNFYDDYIKFNESKDVIPWIVLDVGISSIILVLMFIYLIITAGQEEKGGMVTLRSVDKIYNDVRTIFVLIAAIISFSSAVILIEGTRHTTDAWAFTAIVIIGIIFVIDVAIALSYLCSISRQIKCRKLWRNTLASYILRKIGSLFSGKTFKIWMVFLMFAYGGVNCILTILVICTYGFSRFIFTICFCLFNIISPLFFVRALSSLTKIMVAAREISEGNINYELNIGRISPSFINFATDMAGIQRGFKKSVEEAVKGERMKIDLITNVSHDLKTPLTSIITYVDLLKKEKVVNENAKKYINVLDEKSSRLKQLIEDLIEASKASSGNLTVNKQKVDLRQLVMQASGEFEEKIHKAGLVFRVNSEEVVAINADGKHMWRIIENLISNVIKYSMPNSRVYIDILKTDTMGIFVIKNISAQPIEVSPDQITERFVRGDESRTTEGSGLGLSIAQSLTSLQNGEMIISIDGDLFKVCIKMPLWVEKKEFVNPNNENSEDNDDITQVQN